MATLNKCMLIGRITAELDPPRHAGQSQVVGFRFAVGRSRKNQQTGQWENDPNPLYIDCEAWISPEGKGVGALIRDHCGKGSELYLEGRLQFDMWDDKNNPGQKRSKHKLVVDTVQFIGSKSEQQTDEAPARQPARGGQYSQGGGATGARTGYQAPQSQDDGDIPF